jgi:RecG-like helicase
MGAIRRFLDRLSESDESRHAMEIRAWADTVHGSVRIAEAPLRESVKIAGVVKRMTVFPMQGKESLEALVADGSGEVAVVFMGRRGIHGLTLGTRVVVEGVMGELRGERRMINPRLEFTA